MGNEQKNSGIDMQREQAGELNEFLVRFWDAARELSNANVIAETACRLVVEKLGVERAYWAELDWATRDYVIGAAFHVTQAPVIAGRFPLDAWEPFTSFHLAGTPVVVNDTQTDPRIPADVRDAYAQIQVGADLATPVISGGQLRCTLAVNQRSPRAWTAQEVALVHGIARWCWAEVERARAETALRESEQNLHGVANIAPDFLWYSDPDGSSPWYNDRWLEYTGQTWEQAIGWGWVEAIHPEDREMSARRYREAVEAGKPLRQEHRIRRHTGEYRWFLVRSEPVLDEHGRVTRMYGAATDIQLQREAMEALRASEEQQRATQERQAFLLKLSDTLRPIGDPVEIQRTATRLLGQQLKASRVFYVLVDKNGETAFIHADYTDGVPRRTGRYSLSAFSPSALGDWRMGRIASTSDVNADPRYSESDRQAYASVSTRAGVGIPLIKDRQLVAILGLNQSTPRQWTEDDIHLASEVAERTWAAVERARAEVALRESEERFRQFANASAFGLWMRDAETLEMQFTSPAVAVIYGVEPDALLGDLQRWSSLIVPDDREIALQHLEEARAGISVVHEFRIRRPSDGVFRWIRNKDFPLRDGKAMPRIGGIAEDVTEAKLNIEHQAVLMAELQHRVRNIMGMTRSMANRTALGAQDTESYRSALEGRLLALSRVQALLTRGGNTGGTLRDILQNEIAAQAHHGGQYELIGAEVMLSPKAVEVLTLAFHELATNALKYGALSVPDGRLAVSWAPFERKGVPWLALDWQETGGPQREPSKRRGFGSELIEARVAYELRGTGKIVIRPGGAHCRLEFPLSQAESILETDAPEPRTVFGGTLDMTGTPDLTGRRVLLVEDDYYMAADAAAALRGAGAEVLGPCPDAAAVIDLLARETPTDAVLDLNLGGGGPRFEIARMLQERGVPFLFLTGYDPDVIPADLSGVARLQKPVPFRTIIESVSQLTPSASVG